MKLLHVSENVGNLSSKDSTCFSTDINYKKRSLLYASLHGFYLVCFFISVPWNSNTWKLFPNHVSVCYLLNVTSLGNWIPNSLKFFANNTQ